MMRISPPKKQWPVALALTVLCVVVFAIKLHHAKQLPYYDPNDGDNYFWTEAAFHFRHAAMISHGETIPEIDQQIQYPEGLNTKRSITPMMEHVYGRVHRTLFPRMPLHQFLICATAMFSTLSILCCFFAGRALWGSAWVGLLCASLYGLAPASMVRATGNFLREDFALPFLFGSFACFVICMRRESRVTSGIGALLLIIALASWHISQFFVQLFVFGFVLLVLVYQRGQLPRQTFTIYAGAIVAASVVLNVLRAKFYFLSVPVTLICALLIVLWLLPSDARWPRKRIVALSSVVMLLFGAIGFTVQRITAIHSHVFAVLLAKLQFIGQLPNDPTRLPFEAKTMWNTSFLSPSFGMFVTLLSTTLPFAMLGSVGWGFKIRHRQVTPALFLLLFLAAATLLLMLLFQRLSVFAVFFLALLAGACWPREKANSTRIVTALRTLMLALFVVAVSFELWKYSELRLNPNRPDVELVQDVVSYLRRHAGAGDAVATSFELGPSVAAYADLPVLVHSKFESRSLRDKVRRLYTAFFRDERSLYDLCEELGARYLVYQVDFAAAAGPSSVRYNVGEETLSTQCAAFKFHFAPATMQYFHLVHQNAHYRIYSIGDFQSRERIDPPYEASYDLSLFSEGPLPNELTDQQILAGWKRVSAFQVHFKNALVLMRARRVSEAEVAFGYALELNPRHLGALAGQTRALLELKQYERAGAILARSIAIDPTLEPDMSETRDSDLLIAVAIARKHLGDSNGALNLLQKAVGLNPRNPDAYAQLGRFYITRRELNLAIDALSRSLAIDPNQSQLRRLLEDVRVLADRERQVGP